MVKMAVERIREMMASEEAPEEKNLKECPSCWYRRICYT
jgi:radical SAM protein with 4Fe4S-binding SPASM domain